MAWLHDEVEVAVVLEVLGRERGTLRRMRAAPHHALIDARRVVPNADLRGSMGLGSLPATRMPLPSYFRDSAHYCVFASLRP